MIINCRGGYPKKVIEIPDTWDAWSNVELLNNIEVLKEQVQLFVNFKCGFNEKGCKRFQVTEGCSEGIRMKMKMCCCGECAVAGGYLDMVRESDVQKYLELWNEKTGYWRPDGCVLPRKMRSIICTYYYCSEGMPEKERKKIAILRMAAYTMTRELIDRQIISERNKKKRIA